MRLASAQLASGALHDAVATLQAARAQAGDQPDLLALLATSAAAAQNWTAALDAWSTLFQHHRDAALARAGPRRQPDRPATWPRRGMAGARAALHTAR
ncbi:MAG: hypothetical protein U0Z44_21525 [Kouleothrix sp.]